MVEDHLQPLNSGTARYFSMILRSPWNSISSV